MIDFVKLVLQELQSSMHFFVLMSTILAICGLLYYHAYKRIRGKAPFSWKRGVVYLAFVGYCLIITYITLFRRASVPGAPNLHFLRAWKEAWNNYTIKSWLNVLLNIVMFVPCGALFSAAFKKIGKWHIALIIGAMISLSLETAQLVLKVGVFDVDDLFNNTLGTVIGFSAMEAARYAMLKSIPKRSFVGHIAFLVVTVISIGSIFVVYELQDYGNIPEASTYRVNTKNAIWNQLCDLPEVDGLIPVYRSTELTKEDVEAFGNKFAKMLHIEFDDIEHYDEETYFMDHGGKGGAHFLTVSRRDGSFNYSISYLQEPDTEDVQRDIIEKALADIQITIPDQAEFANKGNGWHRFMISSVEHEGAIVNGTVDCRYASDGTILNLVYNVQTYTYYDDAKIIRPEDALSKLLKGYMGNAEEFERYPSNKYSIANCAIEYKIDTKWFYQPVYVFDIIAEDEDCQIQVFVPAIN